MSFTHRPMQVGDMEGCFALQPDKFVYDDARRRKLFSLWKYLVENDCCVSAVVEDRRKPKEHRIAGFGFSIFLSDSFTRLAKTSLPPFIPLTVMEHWEKGEKPFLLKNEIEAVSAKEGLIVLDLLYGWDEKISPEDAFKVAHLLQELFVTYHSGYRLKEFLHESYGPQNRDHLLEGGNKLRRDYHEFKGASQLKGVAEKNHPYLIGCTREEAMKQPGSFMALFFSKTSQARFQFKPAEKEILQKALGGGTDEDIAESLHLSPWTVKKRWQTVYDKVMKADPELLTDSSQPRTQDAPARQRRRFLLDYLRSHPEEIRMGQATGKMARARKAIGMHNP